MGETIELLGEEGGGEFQVLTWGPRQRPGIAPVTSCPGSLGP
jgi:hypothetical protein